ncbi:MAG: alpha/beta hydrolase [Oceanicaulis sp.]
MMFPPALYLHGLPGSFASEMQIAFGADKKPDFIKGLDRLAALDSEHEYDAAILKAFDESIGGSLVRGSVRIVAFSLGAMPALRIAAFRKDWIASLDLIAPAAPLQLGDFLGDMTGKPVFEAAQSRRVWLDLLTHLQSAGLKVAPGLIASRLFANAPDEERRLMSKPSLRTAFISGAKHTLIKHSRAYRAELRAYVSDWTSTLPEVTAPIRIWQGADDTWTHPDMARAPSVAVGGACEITYLDGLSHYGALVHSLPRICGDESICAL